MAEREGLIRLLRRLTPSGRRQSRRLRRRCATAVEPGHLDIDGSNPRYFQLFQHVMEVSRPDRVFRRPKTPADSPSAKTVIYSI